MNSQHLQCAALIRVPVQKLARSPHFMGSEIVFWIAAAATSPHFWSTACCSLAVSCLGPGHPTAWVVCRCHSMLRHRCGLECRDAYAYGVCHAASVCVCMWMCALLSSFFCPALLCHKFGWHCYRCSLFIASCHCKILNILVSMHGPGDTNRVG